MKEPTFWWGIVMLSCLASVFSLSASNDCLGWAVPLLLALGGGLIYGGQKLYRHTLYKYHNFKIALLNCRPNDSSTPSAAAPLSLKILPVQPCTLNVEVRPSLGFQVKSVNFRFVAKQDIGTRVPVRSPVRVVSVNDHENASIIRSSRDDGYNGVDLEYADVRVQGKNRCLFFEIVVDPQGPWTGMLSFKGRDSDGFCSYGRYDLEFRK
jgi:hypothetical protein